MKLLKGQMESDWVPTDTDVQAVVEKLQVDHPDKTIIAERRPGGSVRLYIFRPNSDTFRITGLQVASPQGAGEKGGN